MAKKAGTLDIEKLMAELNPEKTAKQRRGGFHGSGSEKIRLCDLDWTSKCGKIHSDEPSDRAEDRHYVSEATDYQKQNSDCVYG